MSSVVRSLEDNNLSALAKYSPSSSKSVKIATQTRNRETMCDPGNQPATTATARGSSCFWNGCFQGRDQVCNQSQAVAVLEASLRTAIKWQFVFPPGDPCNGLLIESWSNKCEKINTITGTTTRCLSSHKEVAFLFLMQCDWAMRQLKLFRVSFIKGLN